MRIASGFGAFCWLCVLKYRASTFVRYFSYARGGKAALSKLPGRASMEPIIERLTQRYTELNSTNVPMEGNISWGLWKDYVRVLLGLAQPVTRILEIGFNAGHSCALFCETFPSAQIVSIDVPTNQACAPAKALIDRWYPNRHTLILEDSRTAVPNLEGQFDLLFIDGHHDAPYPETDLFNCQRVAAPGAIVVIDDAYGDLPYSVAPAAARRRFQQLGAYVELGSWISADARFGFSYGQYAKPVESLAALFTAPPATVSVLIGCYGDYPQYSLRAVRSVVQPNRHYAIHVGGADCGATTAAGLQKHFADGEIDSLFLTRQNINKERADTEYVLWMDDDSHFTHPDWATRLQQFIAHHTFDVAGHVFFVHSGDDYRRFRNARPWWRGEQHFLAPDHATRTWFPTGGLFLARTAYLREHDFPDRLMVKRMDDILLGDMISQTHGKLVTFSHELLQSMIISDGNRRGSGESVADWKYAPAS
jgi:predicted O-methyltransferase YrrM